MYLGAVRLLLFVTDLKLGGTPTVVRELAMRMQGDVEHVEVACLGGRDEVAVELDEFGVPVTAFDVGIRHLPAAVRRLRDLQNIGKIDTILSFLVHANVVAALASRGTSGVVWWQSIQTTQPKPRWHWPVQRWAARHATGVIVPSPSVADVAISRCCVLPENVHVIPNGVDATLLAREPRPARDPESPQRVVFLGRLDPVKRIPMLMRAVARVDRARLDIFGDGPERATLEAQAATLPQVTLHGSVSRERALRDADVLVLPSEAEGFGLVLIEAMAAGVPVAGANVPGIRDVVDQEKGLLFGDERQLVRVLQDLRDHPAPAAERAAMALRWVREQRTWDRVVPAYLDLLSSSAATRVSF